MGTRLTLLLLLLGVACQSISDDTEREITVVLLENGGYSLNGQPVADSEFPAAYARVAQRYQGEALHSQSHTRIRVQDPAGTTWARLEPVLLTYCEHYGEALYLEGQKYFSYVCKPCSWAEREHEEFAPIRIAKGTRPEALRARLEPAEGEMVRIYCQPACPLDLFLALLPALDDAGIAYEFSSDPPEDGSLILIVPDLDAGDEEEPEEPEGP